MTEPNDTREQQLPYVGREPTPEERTIQLLTANAEARDHATFNFWHAKYQPHSSAFFADECWRAMKPEVRESYVPEMFAELRAYHALPLLERELYNRGALKTLLDHNDAALQPGVPDGAE